MALKYSFILEAIDKVTAPSKRAKSGLGQLTAGVRKMGAAMRKARADVDSGARSVEHFQRRARRLRSLALGRTFQAAGDSARRMGRGIADATRKLKLMERAGRGAKGALGWMGGKALDMAKWGLAAGVAGGGFAIFDLFRTAGQFEQYQIQLEGIEGSAAKARKAMRWVQSFAEKTPYELEQVMEAFIALKAYGIDPMNGSLMSLGDGAAGMSKPLMQAIEALADATTGEFERLKEFGIRASKQGDRVVFTYRKNGKDLRREARFTGSEIEKAITGIFSERFGGGMARQATTLFGIISNLKDLWSKFLVMIADAGIFDKVKKKLDEWRGKLDAMAKDGRLKKWAETISDWLEKAFDWLVKFTEDDGWKKVGQNLKTIGEAAVILANAIIKAYNFGKKFSALKFPVGMALNPAGTALDMFSQWREGAAGKPARKVRRPSNGRGNPVPARPRRNPKISAAGIGSAAPPVTVGGKTEIDIRYSGPLLASVRSSRSDNRSVPSVVNLGKTMRGAA